MKVLYALTCEDAGARADGRMDIHGVFHQLYAPGFPAQQDRLVLAMVLEWDAGETGRVHFKIDVLDPSRSPTLTINGHTDVGDRQQGEAPPQTRLVLPLENVVFPAAGTYDFELSINGNNIPLVPLHLVRDPDAA